MLAEFVSETSSKALKSRTAPSRTSELEPVARPVKLREARGVIFDVMPEGPNNPPSKVTIFSDPVVGAVNQVK
jgi:hypothetical protein